VTGRPSKLVDLDEAVDLVRPGSHVAFGGFLAHNKPSAFVRGLLRAGTDELTIYSCPAASYDADLLIGAGLVDRTVLAQVSFGGLGPAPRWTDAVANGTIDVEVCDEAIVVGGYMATIEGIPYHPLASARGHDIVRESTLAKPYRTHTGHELVAASPLAPDVAILHVQQADVFGNGRHLGSTWGDEIVAKAAKRVILTTDEIVDNAAVRADPRATTVPGYLVDAVVHVPYGAHPCASHGAYLADESHLRAYIAQASTAAGFAEYVEEWVRPSHDTYLETVGGATLAALEHRFPW
jgi:glutaconate CoA-transferase, subunit A